MAFRKRNVALTRSDLTSGSSNPSIPGGSPASPKESIPQPVPGVRPSPIDGRPTTSTGTPSLDAILAGHAGLPLGNSLLVEESGTTDYAGALLRFYAAEGVVQGHCVHVVGMGEAWGRELPGLSDRGEDGRRKKSLGDKESERMKIAWRYEGLGVFGERGLRGVPPSAVSLSTTDVFPGTPNRNIAQGDGKGDEAAIFCHTFDLAKRLTLPVGSLINYIPIPRTQGSPFTAILKNLRQKLETTPSATIHRLVVPSLLSPAFYPPASSQPHHILQFLHGLRALLRLYPTRLTAISTLPISLYPRDTGLIRWIEILADGVLELSPFPYNHAQALSTSAAATKEEERPQGMFAVHKLPVWSEKGGGGTFEGLGENLAFTLSRRRFVISKFSLPPAEGDTEAQEAVHAAAGSNMPKKQDLEF